MVDPVQLALAPLAGRAINAAITYVFGSATDSKAPRLELDTTVGLVDDEHGEYVGIFTHAQIEDIERFLGTPEVASLYQSWCILRLVNAAPREIADLFTRMADSFSALASQWCQEGDDSWESYAEDIWRLSTNAMEQATAGLANLPLATDEDSEIFQKFTTGAQLLRGKRPPAPQFIRRIVDILSSLDRVIATRATTHDICAASKEHFSELQLNHVQDDYRFEVDQLYVSRALTLQGTERTRSSNDVLSAENGRPRAVIIGDPGVGKSTLIRHTIYKIASQERAHMAPLLVECREYAGSSWGTSLIEFICARLAAEQSLQITEDAMLDALSLGSAYVVFDGVDEIIDLSKRREFIRRIESFGRTFPLVPILATSRRVGYNRASFQGDLFQVFELDEFTELQFVEYVDRWFEATKRDVTERDSFIRESEAVADIKCNPLMLSLLCTLYRARGHIPRNRRQVYRDCADLLFQRWDAMRHVEQPYDHRHYGERLMQELARFFYKNQSTQGGVEEAQLERLVAHFFEDTASVDPPESMTRARQFLDFCATRAWLLTVKGSSTRGVRLFAFTHRTFMEYLAAEALVRNATNTQQVTEEIVRVFEADPSSVLPDVLVQCVDDKFDRGAESVLRTLLNKGQRASTHGDKYLSLCLRIVNSSPMSRAISGPLPGEVLSYWSKIGRINETVDSSRAFFELYRDPRNRMLRALAEESAGSLGHLRFASHTFTAAVCKRWARFAAVGETHYFEPEWQDGLDPHFADLAHELQAAENKHVIDFDLPVVDYLIGKGALVPSQLSTKVPIQPALCVYAFDYVCPGAVTRALLRYLYGDSNISDSDRQLIKWFVTTRLPKLTLSESEALDISAVLDTQVRAIASRSAENLIALVGPDQYVLDFLLWLAFVVYEAKSPSFHALHETFDGVVGIERFRDLVATREKKLGVDTQTSGTALSKEQVRLALVGFPSWAASWVRGKAVIHQAQVRRQ